MSEKLLTRDEFREAVFKRDGYKCIFCDKKAQDAHHILERRLYGESGGYFLSNGASVCGEHHIECEKTTISVEQVREAAGITKPKLPDHFYDDIIYDKWGNTILPNGKRTPGELFHDESVQKILKEGDVLHLFVKYVKYPRTYHLSFSPGMHDDDRALKDSSQFEGKRVIATVKMDGESSSLYSDYFHARSVDSRNHPSRNWAKNFWSSIKYNIPEGWRICAENVYAKHSIAYENLESYVYGFSIWNDKNICLSWDETVEWFQLLGIVHPKILYDGIWDEEVIRSLYDEKTMYNTCEGFVVRIADSFPYGKFRDNVAKYVRKGHVMTTQHWMHGQSIIENKLK